MFSVFLFFFLYFFLFCFVFNLCRLNDVHFHLVFMIIGHNSCFTSFSWKRFVWQFICIIHISFPYMHMVYMFLVKYETNFYFFFKQKYYMYYFYLYVLITNKVLKYMIHMNIQKEKNYQLVTDGTCLNMKENAH